MSDRQLVYNAIRTPDGTILESTHRHDYITHEDANGLLYMVDGGLEYIRRNVHMDAPYVDLAVYSDEPHEKIREVVKWGTYGKSGRDPMTYVKIGDMTTDHIKACLTNIPTIKPYIREVMQTELKYRGEGYEQDYAEGANWE